MAATTTDPQVQPLTVFLIKKGTTRIEDALDDEAADRLTRYSLRQDLPFEGDLFLAPQRNLPPRWLQFLADGARDDLEGLYNASNSAVLVIRASRRIFAITFGYGRSLLNPMRIERSFGLRVVLNTVEQEGLRSVDTRIVQELTVHTRRQASRASPLTRFGVDKEEDLLGAITGIPRDPSFARMVSGADALQFRAALRFEELGEKCREVLREYKSEEYKSRGFEFVDHVQRVTDPAIVEALDCDLVNALAARELDGMHMAPPEIVDWAHLDGFSFVKGADPEPDLRFESLFEQIRNAGEISVDRLKRQRVFVHATGAAEATPSWSLYRALVADRELSRRKYVLSGGEWYEIEKGFAAEVARRVAKLESANLSLPAAGRDEHEDAYNTRVAKRGLYCIDRKCARLEGDAIELCDLYASKSRSFVHVKRWKSSSTLSHLFAQGKVSAEALMFDEGFRREARDLLHEQAPSLASHIPNGRPDAGSYRVVFGIIKGGQGWKRALPFFSQLHLVRSAETLRRLGFDVRLEQIEVEAE